MNVGFLSRDESARTPRVQTTAARDAVYLRRVARLKRGFWGRRAAIVFIVWQLFVLLVWQLFLPPFSFRPAVWLMERDRLNVMRTYLFVTGFIQSWTMFAPHPDRKDDFVRAKVVYADGDVRWMQFPRLRDMGFWRKMPEERWRKVIENAQSNRFVWPCLVRYAARRMNVIPGDRPVEVVLIAYIRIVPAPGKSAGPYRAFPFNKAVISPGDLL